MIRRTLASSTRIRGLVAREAPRVLLLRRGPTKQVATILWHTDTNEFFLGQWFKGRIHDHVSDLSPSGKPLVYRAESHRGPFKQWTAISRPPFLTALTLWAGGGAWGGGGLFDSETRIRLNHGGVKTKPEKGFAIPAGVHVSSYDEWMNPKRQWPVNLALAQRNGWKLRQERVWKVAARSRRRGLDITTPEIRWKARGNWILEMAEVRYGDPGEPGIVRHYRVLDEQGDAKLDLGECDWADWSYDGRLLTARDGRLYDAPVSKARGPGNAKQRLDLRDMEFEAIASPEEARRWTGEVAGRRIG